MVPLQPPLWEMNLTLYRYILGEATIVLKFRHSCRYLGAEISCFSPNHGICKYQTDTTVYLLQQGNSKEIACPCSTHWKGSGMEEANVSFTSVYLLWPEVAKPLCTVL